MYATLSQVRNELLTAKTSAIDDARVLLALRQVSRRIQQMAGIDFEPYYESRTLDANPQFINTLLQTYDLPQWMLTLTALTVNNKALTVGTDVLTYPPGQTPFRVLRLTANPLTTSTRWYPDRVSGAFDLLGTIKVTGYWGYRSRYATQGWLNSLDTVQNAPSLSASSTSLTVSDADGLDDLAQTPRFAVGQLIRFEDFTGGVHEIAEVTAVNTTTNVLTIRRGVRGTTATAHPQNTVISIFQVEDIINRVAIRQAALLYTRRGAFQSAEVGEFGIVQYPVDLLIELSSTLSLFANNEVVN